MRRSSFLLQNHIEIIKKVLSKISSICFIAKFIKIILELLSLGAIAFVSLFAFNKNVNNAISSNLTLKSLFLALEAQAEPGSNVICASTEVCGDKVEGGHTLYYITGTNFETGQPECCKCVSTTSRGCKQSN